MRVVPIPALSDNYIWLLHDGADAVLVDPGEALPARNALAANRLGLRAILLTHHHPDHVGGALALRDDYDVPVYAPDDTRIEATTATVMDGDTVRLERPALTIEVLAVPGHTRSHVAYLVAGHLFSGDTLFSMGCGRLFEGTPSQMLASLDRLAQLPDATEVCCGHEYTQANARFARQVEPENHALAVRAADVAQQRALLRPTLPVRLAEERQTNPFLRTDADAVVHWCAQRGARSRVERFAALRAAKDAFRG